MKKSIEAIDKEIKNTRKLFAERDEENQEDPVMDSDFGEYENSIFDCGYIAGLLEAKFILQGKNIKE